ncbi:phosphatidylglycerol lysyltransferase domain-containing protein [Xanthomonas axonopodis]
MDFLFIELFLWGQRPATRGSRWACAWSGLAEHRLAGANCFASLVARHGERFYGFSGLRRFKSKFAPTWRHVTAAPGGMHLPAALLDVTRLISAIWRGRKAAAPGMPVWLHCLAAHQRGYRLAGAFQFLKCRFANKLPHIMEARVPFGPDGGMNAAIASSLPRPAPEAAPRNRPRPRSAPSSKPCPASPSTARATGR